MPRKATEHDYPAAFLVKCSQCSSIYLIGLTSVDSVLANVCSVFTNNYKCPGRLVSLERSTQSIAAFRKVLRMLENDLFEEKNA